MESMPCSRPGDRLRLCVAIPTFRRTATLGGLLAALSGQSTVAADVEVLVLDNDPEGSARSVVDAARTAHRYRLHYDVVMQPGVASIRNRALDFAQGGFDLLAMIDDDEVPERQWLYELLRVHGETRADAVIGPVPGAFSTPPPAWITRGGFFSLPSFADGEALTDGYSGNCLLDVASVRAYDLHFDPAMNEAGGEDQLFFRQMVARGGRIVFAAAATAVETIPPERLTLRYVVFRNLRMGSTLAICDREIHGTLRALTLRCAKGIALLVISTLLLFPRGIAGGLSGWVRTLCDGARGAGMLAGLAGIRILEYRRTNPPALPPPSPIKKVP